jgi:hypothetical protein
MCHSKGVLCSAYGSSYLYSKVLHHLEEQIAFDAAQRHRALRTQPSELCVHPHVLLHDAQTGELAHEELPVSLMPAQRALLALRRRQLLVQRQQQLLQLHRVVEQRAHAAEVEPVRSERARVLQPLHGAHGGGGGVQHLR